MGVESTHAEEGAVYGVWCLKGNGRRLTDPENMAVLLSCLARRSQIWCGWVEGCQEGKGCAERVQDWTSVGGHKPGLRNLKLVRGDWRVGPYWGGRQAPMADSLGTPNTGQGACWRVRGRPAGTRCAGQAAWPAGHAGLGPEADSESAGTLISEFVEDQGSLEHYTAPKTYNDSQCTRRPRPAHLHACTPISLARATRRTLVACCPRLECHLRSGTLPRRIARLASVWLSALFHDETYKRSPALHHASC